jgi:hypothetical protein
MEGANLRIEVRVVTDTRFDKKPKEAIWAADELPEQARGFERGPQSMIACATDDRGIVVVSAAAHILVHPTKPPIVHVVYAGADPPYTGQGLERVVVKRLIDGARSQGCTGVWICKDVKGL